MSTASELNSPASRIPGGKYSKGKQSKETKGAGTEEVKQALHEHLRKTANFIKLLDSLVLLAAWIAGLLVIWLAACLVDHWLLPLPSLARWLFWLTGVAGSVWWGVIKLVPLVLNRINLTYAAQRIEHLVPEFKNGLVSWLELEQLPEHGVPRGVMAALAYRAKRFIGGQDPSSTVDTSPLIKLIGAVFLLVTSLVVYTMVTPKSVMATGQRILMPWSEMSAPTRVAILEVKPGNILLTQGKPLQVDVQARGLLTDEPVFVRYNTLDGQLTDQLVELPVITEGFQFAGAIRTTTQGIEHELDYYIEAGDAMSGPFRVTLSPLPSVDLESVQLEYPEYTKLPPRTIAGGKVEAVEGTLATVLARANQSMKEGRLEVNPELDENGELVRSRSQIQMKVKDRELKASLLLALNAEGENPTQVGFRIRGYNERGDVNPRPILHDISVFADVAPEVSLLGPEDRILRVRPDASVSLEIRASDPDFGLTKIVIGASKNGRAVGKKELLNAPEGVSGKRVEVAQIDLGKLRAQPGDRISLVATASDNRHAPRTKRLEPNISESQPLILEVVGPTEPADVEPKSAEKATENSKARDNQQTVNRSDSSESGSKPANGSDSNNTENGNSSANSDSGGGGQDAQSNADGGGAADTQESSGRNEAGESSDSNSTDGASGDSSSAKSGATGASDNQSPGEGSSGEDPSGNGSGKSAASNTGAERSDSATGGENSAGDQSGEGGKQGGRGQQDASRSETGESSTSNGEGAAQGRSEDGQVIERVKEYMERNGADRPDTANGDGSESAPDTQAKESPEGKDPSDANDSSGDSQSGSEGGQSGSEGGQSGSEGGQSGSEGGQSGSEGGQSGSEGGQSGSEGGQSGSEGGQSGSEGGQSGSEGNQSGSEGNQSGSEGNQSGSEGNQSGSEGNQSGSEGNQSGSEGNQSGSEGGQSGSEGGQSGSEGGQSGSEGGQSGSEGGQSGSEGGQSGSEGGQSGSEGGQSGSEGGQSSNSGASSDDSGTSKDETGNTAGGEGTQDGGAQGKSSGAEAGGSESGGSESGGSESGGSESGGSESGGSESGGAESGGSKTGAQSASGSAKGSGGPSGQGPPTNSKGGAKGGGKSTGGGSGGGKGMEAASGTSQGAGSQDDVNLEFAEKQTDMVLDYLERQRDQPDSELLNELDWTDRDLKQFVDRWRNARDLAKNGNDADRLRWKEKLKQLGLAPPNSTPVDAGNLNDDFQQMLDSGNRTRPPKRLQRDWAAFLKAVGEL